MLDWFPEFWKDYGLFIIAIVAIGVVGLLLEQALVALARAFSYEQVAS